MQKWRKGRMEGVDTYSCIASTLISLPELTQPHFFLFPQIGMLLYLSLIESVDNGILARYNMYALDLDIVSIKKLSTKI